MLAEGLTPNPEEMRFKDRGASATIQIAQHDDGRWMWAMDAMCGTSGRGYHVGPKWGRFAESRDAAMAEAMAEVEDFCRQNPGSDAQRVRSWLANIQPAQPDLFGIAA